MDHRAQVSALCARLRIDNHPETGIPEESLGISELVFHTAKGEERIVYATPMNKASQLLLEEVTRERGNRKHLTIDEELKARLVEYFAEKWPDVPDPNRPLLFNLATCIGVDVKWKADYWTRKPLK